MNFETTFGLSREVTILGKTYRAAPLTLRQFIQLANEIKQVYKDHADLPAPGDNAFTPAWIADATAGGTIPLFIPMVVLYSVAEGQGDISDLNKPEVVKEIITKADLDFMKLVFWMLFGRDTLTLKEDQTDPLVDFIHYVDWMTVKAGLLRVYGKDILDLNIAQIAGLCDRQGDDQVMEPQLRQAMTLSRRMGNK